MEGQNLLVAVRIRPTAESKQGLGIGQGVTMAVPRNNSSVVTIRDPGRDVGRGLTAAANGESPAEERRERREGRIRANPVSLSS